MVYRVLIIDDAGFIREIISTVAKNYGCDMVIEATTGLEAIPLARKMKPHLIFLDLVMPKKNGFETAQEILDQNPLAKIVAMSTLDENHLKDQIIDLGCKEFMEKPFTKEKLIGILNRYRPFNTEVENV